MDDTPSSFWSRSALPHHLGFVLLEQGDGHAVVRVRLTAELLNAHGTAHGGLVFTLADTAFGMAANGGAARAVTQQASINFLSPAEAGEVLTARARQVSRSGRSAILDVTVTAGDDARVIALFRGQARFISG